MMTTAGSLAIVAAAGRRCLGAAAAAAAMGSYYGHMRDVVQGGRGIGHNDFSHQSAGWPAASMTGSRAEGEYGRRVGGQGWVQVRKSCHASRMRSRSRLVPAASTQFGRRLNAAGRRRQP